MVTRPILALAFLAFTTSPITASEINTGFVVMTTTADPASVTLHVTIDDEGQVPGCQWFGITRYGIPVAVIPRDVGNTITFDFVDTNVGANAVYWYELQAWKFPFSYPDPTCDLDAFRIAFGSSWGGPIDVPALTGPGPTPFYRGRLVADESWPGAHLELCGSPQSWIFFDDMPPGSFDPWIDTEVVIYGEYTDWSVQFGWGFHVTLVEPSACAPLAVQESTWGGIKSMYR